MSRKSVSELKNWVPKHSKKIMIIKNKKYKIKTSKNKKNKK